MRHNFITLAGGALTLLLVGAAPSAQADQTFAKDNASDAVYGSGGSFNNLNGGFGFGAWSVNAPNGGSFTASSSGNGGTPNIDSTGSTGSKAFGIYSNGAQTTATRPLTTPLAVGQTFSLDFDNGGVDNGGSSVGFYLSNGSNSPLTVYYANADGNQYRVVDGSGTYGTGFGFTNGGLHAAFALNTATTYTFTLSQLGGSSYTRSGTLTGGISSISFFSNNPGGGPSHDVFVNNLAVTTPAPSALVPMAGGLAVLFGSLKRRKRKE